MSRLYEQITRRVRSIKREGKTYRYTLECGHVVERPFGGKKFCFCARCIEPYIDRPSGVVRRA